MRLKADTSSFLAFCTGRATGWNSCESTAWEPRLVWVVLKGLLTFGQCRNLMAILAAGVLNHYQMPSFAAFFLVLCFYLHGVMLLLLPLLLLFDGRRQGKRGGGARAPSPCSRHPCQLRQATACRASPPISRGGNCPCIHGACGGPVVNGALGKAPAL